MCAQSTARERGLSAHGDSIDKGVPGRGGSRGEETAAGEGRALFAFDPGNGRGGRYNHLVLARSQIQEVFPLAACPWLAENSRLGFRLVGSTLHQGPQPFKYLNGVGDTTSVVWNAWPESLKAQQQSGSIANAAANQEGSGTYEYQNRTGSFPSNTNKCNEFVADTVASTGAAKPQVPKSGILGWLGFTRDPTAKEWATMSIKGWSAPDSVANARPGDVIAVGHTHDAEGHVGIVVSPGWTASANAKTTPAGIITVNNWGFRPAGANDEGGSAVVVRHYLGGDQ